jgi:hypothetical protein
MTRLNNGGILGNPVTTPSPISATGKWNSSDQFINKKQNYWTHSVVSSGLQLFLDAGNTLSYPGSGSTWYDLSGYGRNATVFGSNRFSSNDGGKFDFRNISTASDYISLPASAAQASANNNTIIFWMQPVSNGARYFHSIHNGSTDNYQIMTITSNTISSFLGGSSVSFTDNEWLQVSLVRNNSDSGTMYKNDNAGVPATIANISAAASGGWILNQEQDLLGGGFDSNQNAYSSFSAILLYNRVLSTDEISYNYNYFKSRYGI